MGIYSNMILEGVELVWARKGNQLVRKFRCKSGPRAGRIVNSVVDCNKPLDVIKKETLKITKAKKGKLMQKRSKKTKAKNQISKKMTKLNRGK